MTESWKKEENVASDDTPMMVDNDEFYNWY